MLMSLINHRRLIAAPAVTSRLSTNEEDSHFALFVFGKMTAKMTMTQTTCAEGRTAR
jgi:hypothetical protein